MLDNHDQVNYFSEYSYWCILRNVTVTTSQEVFVCSLRIKTEGHFLIRVLIGDTVSSSVETRNHVEIIPISAPSASILGNDEPFVLRLTHEIFIHQSLLECSFLQVSISFIHSFISFLYFTGPPSFILDRITIFLFIYRINSINHIVI